MWLVAVSFYYSVCLGIILLYCITCASILLIMLSETSSGYSAYTTVYIYVCGSHNGPHCYVAKLLSYWLLSLLLDA